MQSTPSQSQPPATHAQKTVLTAHEARVIGCLLEKEITTPEQYPLSLNALTLACNQKSSREPVYNLSESDVQAAIDSLAKKRLINEQSGFGSRVVKYQHRFCNTEFSELQLSPAALAVICLLLLRGAQTAGELRTRSNRLHEFNDVHEVEVVLEQLQKRETPLVIQLAKEPGRRECRYQELFSTIANRDVHTGDENKSAEQEISSARSFATESSGVTQAQFDALVSRIDTLEHQVAHLQSKLSD